ncbi:MAG: hypothetical protein NTV22_11405 [bacterium]|nr:hypothetical protein [bacterium]
MGHTRAAQVIGYPTARASRAFNAAAAVGIRASAYPARAHFYLSHFPLYFAQFKNDNGTRRMYTIHEAVRDIVAFLEKFLLPITHHLDAP